MHTSSCHFPLRPLSSNPSSRKLADSYRRRPQTSIVALKSDAYDKDHHNGRIVDENMVVLKKRIYDIKAVEAKHEAPTSWMEWEKGYFRSYYSDIFEAMGFLQCLLMETRPSLAIGMLALVVLSISTSTVDCCVGFMMIIGSHVNQFRLSQPIVFIVLELVNQLKQIHTSTNRLSQPLG